MFRLFTICLAVVSSTVMADTELTQEEISNILKTLTARKSKTWIDSGVISANHQEFKAAKVTDANELDLEVEKAVQESINKGVNNKELEVVPFNTRYRLGNSYDMVSKETVKIDGDKFHWEIEVNKRDDTIQPKFAEKVNRSIKYFMMDWNKQRVFSWDGEKKTSYFRSGNYAIITSEKVTASGPATAGYIPWGIGKWSYEELSKCDLEGFVNDKNEIKLIISNNVYVRDLILDPSRGYLVKSYIFREYFSGIEYYFNYSSYKEVCGNFVPETVLIEKYENQRLFSREVWTGITVKNLELTENNFTVNFDYNATIEDQRFGDDSFYYRYMPPLELSAERDDSFNIYYDKLEYLSQVSNLESNCAQASLWYSFTRLGKFISVQKINKLLRMVNGESSISDMLNVIKEIEGLKGFAVIISPKDLARSKGIETILYLPKEKHFVNYLAEDSNYIYLSDINDNKLIRSLSHSEFKKAWQGLALWITNSDRRMLNIEPSEEKIKNTFGAGNCLLCKITQEHTIVDSNCIKIGSDCDGTADVEEEIKKCLADKEASIDDDCSESPKPSYVKKACEFNEFNDCVGTGAKQTVYSWDDACN